MFTARHLLAFTALAASSAFAACKSHDNAATDSASGTAATATPANTTATAATPATDTSMKPAMTDANILALADIGDSAEVTVAKYMSTNATNAQVKSYASLLVHDHTNGKSAVESAAKSLKISLELPANDTTAQSASHTLDRLKSLNGMDRDTAFINHEIADHQQDIDETNKMIAAATQPRVKSLLQKELPELQKHLDRAQAISTSMAKK